MDSIDLTSDEKSIGPARLANIGQNKDDRYDFSTATCLVNPVRSKA